MSNMDAMLAGLDRRDTKNQIRDTLTENLAMLGMEVSRSRADRLANAYKRGRLDELDPELQRVIGYSDITGETAVRRVLAAAGGPRSHHDGSEGAPCPMT